MAEESRKLRMLVVEDDRFIRKLVMGFFESDPFEFYEAENGEEALDRTMEHHPDVIITDLMLPKMDGATFIRRLRMTKDFATTPIIAITAGTEELKEQAKKAGAHVVLSKPLREAEVTKLVNDLLAATPFIKR